MTWHDLLTWQEAIEVARFLQVPVIDLDKIPVSYVEQALVIIRAKMGSNE